MTLFISPKTRTPIDASDVSAWVNPIINPSRFDGILKAKVDGVVEGQSLPAIQFRRYETDNNGGNEWVSWLYASEDDRDAEYKRLMRLLRMPQWLRQFVLILGG